MSRWMNFLWGTLMVGAIVGVLLACGALIMLRNNPSAQLLRDLDYYGADYYADEQSPDWLPEWVDRSMYAVVDSASFSDPRLDDAGLAQLAPTCGTWFRCNSTEPASPTTGWPHSIECRNCTA